MTRAKVGHGDGLANVRNDGVVKWLRKTGVRNLMESTEFSAGVSSRETRSSVDVHRRSGTCASFVVHAREPSACRFLPNRQETHPAVTADECLYPKTASCVSRPEGGRPTAVRVPAKRLPI